MKKIIITLLSAGIFLSAEMTSADASKYHVSHSSTMSWKASYDISTKGNKITNVYHIQAKTYVGHISNMKIIHNSSNKVTLSLVKTVGTLKYPIHLSATIKNHKLIVSSN